jgi:hypothetical protein
MFFVFVVPIGLAIGLAVGGTPSGLGKLPLRGLLLLPPALLIQLLIFPVFTEHAVISIGTAPLHTLSYLLLAVWIVANSRLLPILLLGVGAASNLIVVIANGGFMPASIAALQKAGLFYPAERLTQDGVFSNLIPMSAHTQLNLLGDFLYLPKWIPLSSAFSIGDLIILLALIWLIVKGMRIDGKRSREAA